MLAVWCVLAPAETARSVGFELTPGSGQSEYLVVYGGLQLGLAWLFLQPLWRRKLALAMLEACAIVHGCIVALRLVSFWTYDGIQSTTYILAALEWGILLGSLGLFWRAARQDAAP